MEFITFEQATYHVENDHDESELNDAANQQRKQEEARKKEYRPE